MWTTLLSSLGGPTWFFSSEEPSEEGWEAEEAAADGDPVVVTLDMCTPWETLSSLSMCTPWETLAVLGVSHVGSGGVSPVGNGVFPTWEAGFCFLSLFASQGVLPRLTRNGNGSNRTPSHRK